MAPSRDLAICLVQQEWSESSQIVTLLTREHGLVRALAKGARREKSAFSGGLETLTRGEAMFIVKPQGLDLLTAWDLTDPAAGFRLSLERFRIGLYAADAARHLILEGDPHPRAFDALDRFVERLGRADADRDPLNELLRFLVRLAEDTGHRPETALDPATGEALAPAEVYAFSLEGGGARPRDLHATRTDPSEVLIRGETLRGIRGARERDSSDLSPVVAGRAVAFLDAWLGYRLGRRLPASASLIAAIRTVSHGRNDPPD